MKPILSAEQLTKNYGRENVIKGITLALYEETFTAVRVKYIKTLIQERNDIL